MMKGKKSKSKGIEALRQRYGYMFVLPWTIGLIMFIVIPLVSSLWYAFCNVKIESSGIITEFTGLDNFETILFKDPKYTTILTSSLSEMFYTLPFLISIALILAVLLNQHYLGRSFMRVIFFMPIIILTSPVLKLLGSEFVRMPLFFLSSSSGGLSNYDLIIENVDIPSQFVPIFTFLLRHSTNIIWTCGIQVILFLAGLQGIPTALYEACKIEGANKWEEFWMITVPSLRNIISLVIVYTMIDLFSRSWVVSSSYERMLGQDYDKSSAMVWLYFVVVGASVGAVYALYHKFCVKRWE